MKLVRTMSVVAAAVTLACVIHRAAGDGAMFTAADRINEADQRAAVLFRQGKEDLIISPTFASPATRFAWVVPVPTRPEVAVLDNALFSELAGLGLEHRTPGAGTGGGRGGFGGPMGGSVTVFEEKLIGGYDVTVLTATASSALMKWLSQHRYYVPASAERAIQEYIAEGWGFVACRVQTPPAAGKDHTGRLAPLRLTFRTRLPVYPMRLSSANPRPFSLLVYFILPESEWRDGRPFLLRRSGPLGFHRPPQPWGRLARKQSRYPTLERLIGEGAAVYTERGREVSPGACVQDFVWLTKPFGRLGTAAFGRP